MNILNPLFLVGTGIGLLYAGGEGLVRGSSAMAIRMGLTPLIVGLTVVAFGTSTPEFLVSLRAVLDGSAPIALGNVVGSNIANIGLILGLAALVRPLHVSAHTFRIDVPIVIATSLLLPLLLLDRTLGRAEGAGMFALLLLYLFLRVRAARQETDRVREEWAEAIPRRPGAIARDLLFVIGGLALLALGARWLVTGAVQIARHFSISEAVIGLTIVAVGTSLPELAASMVASARGEGDICIGNVLGSNLFNILGVLGVTAAIRPLAATDVTLVDYAVMIAYALVLLPMARSGARLSRLEGGALLIAYIGYMSYLLLR